MENRQSIRLLNYDYSQNGMYFVTVCTQNREYLFGDIINGQMNLNPVGEMIDRWWNKIPNKFTGIKLDIYQIMPNHIHMIINIVRAGLFPPTIIGRENRDGRENRAPTLGQIVAFFKYQSTKSINELSGARTGGVIPAHIPYPKIFQRNFYEHIIRTETDLNKIREYIQTNPQMWDRDRNNPKNYEKMQNSEI